MNTAEERVERWKTRVDVTAWRVGRGEYEQVNQLAELSDEAVRLARDVSPAARAPILDRLRHLEAVILAAQADVKAKLDELPARRRAARRYLEVPRPRGG